MENHNPTNTELLASVLDSEVDSGVGISTAIGVRKNNYRQLVKFANVLSYSMEQHLIACPRKFKLMKLRADSEGDEPETEPNADFAFGHAVGAGVAEYDKTGSLNAAIFAAFLAWNIDLLAESPKKDYRDPKKSFAHAVWALKLYESFYQEQGLDEYEVVNVEATIGVDLEDGYFYVGHIDELLKHRETGRFKVKENKTTVFDSVDPALYANSDQALSYAVVVDAYGEAEYDVFYCVYSSTSQRWIDMPFVKSALAKAEWLQTQLLLTSELEEYSRINFFPKRGAACFNFSRRCEYFETCDFNSDRVFGKKYSELEFARNFADIEAIERLDFKVRLSELVAGQESSVAELSKLPGLTELPAPTTSREVFNPASRMESL